MFRHGWQEKEVNPLDKYPYHSVYKEDNFFIYKFDEKNILRFSIVGPNAVPLFELGTFTSLYSFWGGDGKVHWCNPEDHMKQAQAPIIFIVALDQIPECQTIINQIGPNPLSKYPIGKVIQDDKNTFVLRNKYNIVFKVENFKHDEWQNLRVYTKLTATPSFNFWKDSETIEQPMTEEEIEEFNQRLAPKKPPSLKALCLFAVKTNMKKSEGFTAKAKATLIMDLQEELSQHRY